MSNLSVYKDNSLIDASYKLNTQAQKLVLCCLAKVDSRNEIPKEVTLTAIEFAELMGIEPKNAHRDLYRAANALFDAEITIKENGKLSRLRWVQESVETSNGDGMVTLVWSDKVLKYISVLQNRFTGYKLRNISLLQSSHSIRIYELLMRFKATGERAIQLADFKAALGISGKYSTFKALNRDVLKKSVDELNMRTDLSVTYEPIKKGRKVTGLAFTFK
ncbi:replication initiation protein [Vibrio vulnificus]|uniref:replication initiation protein n=1 Tax=Vibrio vulnificus TaxID=672 RepID=UPI00102CF06D|nr:replication initiation protein [Vibrio vulnificus]RZR39133.1 RepB family plasmid replication initiator protein [Vibrio vulnificus]